MDSHTNADDATRYRSADEVQLWAARDPIERLQRYLIGRGLLDESGRREVEAVAETFAASLRERLVTSAKPDPDDLFRWVYTEPTVQLQREQALLTDELAGVDQ